MDFPTRDSKLAAAVAASPTYAPQSFIGPAALLDAAEAALLLENADREDDCALVLDFELEREEELMEREDVLDLELDEDDRFFTLEMDRE